jgi:hypothetical protein
MASPLRLCAFARYGPPYSGGDSRQGAKTQRPRRRNLSFDFKELQFAHPSIKPAPRAPVLLFGSFRIEHHKLFSVIEVNDLKEAGGQQAVFDAACATTFRLA